MTVPFARRPGPDSPLVVAYGLGVDSKAIGYDAGPADSRRFRYEEDDQYRYWYPLFEWRLDREDCKRIITAAGLPVPMKSACFFCPASKKHEIVWLQEHHPDLLERALA